MANPTKSLGADPVKTRSGTHYRASSWIKVDSANANAIYQNDFIKADNDGNASLSAPSEPILGVAQIFRDADGASLLYLPASTAGEISYIPAAQDPIVSITEDSVGGNISLGQIGNRFDIVAGTPDATLGKSGIMLDSSDATGTGSAQLEVVGLSQIHGNAVGANARWDCRIVEKQAEPTPGTGV